MTRNRHTLTEQLADTLRQQIVDGVLRPGDKLPSIRKFAAEKNCSLNTVIGAFELLVTEGKIEPRRGAGYFVVGRRHPSKEDEPTSLERAMDIVWLMREQLKATPSQLRIGDGFPPIDWLNENRLDKYHQKVIRTGLGTLFRYGSRFGYAPLRQNLVRRLAGFGIECSPVQIVLTHGANQAMDIVIRHFVRPGDNVLVDDPGYYPLFGKLKLQGANIIGVERNPEGPDALALEELIEKHRPRLFFTQSVGHNPTGSDVTPSRAYRILQLAEKYDVLLVENDPMADFKSPNSARIATMDQLQRVIYVGSLSKSISAALRVGFIACHRDLASDLADVKMLIHVSSSEYCERTVDVILNDGNYPRYVGRLRNHLEHATESSMRLLASIGAEIFYTHPHSLYLWARLPGFSDSIELARELLKLQIVMAPGCIFSVDPQQPSPWCRYNVGFVTDPRFMTAVTELLSWKRNSNQTAGEALGVVVQAP